MECQVTRPVALRYLPAGKVEDYLRQQRGHVACVVGFGSVPVAATPSGHPGLWVDMPVAGGGAVYEVWTSAKPVTPYRDAMMSGAINEDIFWGSMSVRLDDAGGLGDAAQRAFTAIFDFLRSSGYPHLIRVWNYFPAINAIEDGMERYRSFTMGRYEAFMHCGRSVEDSPAACALGSHGGPLVIYFLAARHPGLQIENPRQVSAYHYPEQYGPRSPTFSRATLAFKSDPQVLFISGTASIVGHETVHPESVSLQTQETLANIRAVIDHAKRQGFRPADFARGLAFKVYVRHAQDIPLVQEIIRKEFGTLAEMIVLQADVCRTDLLVEVEAACWGGE